jgi:two-component system, OmpR family, sensor histidine kinase BaeS
MLLTLRSRLTLIFASIGLCSIVLVSFMANFQLEWQFIQYTIKISEEENINTLHSIERQYMGDDDWNILSIEQIGINALEEGKIMSLYDRNGMTIWSAREHNSALCSQMIEEMTQKMASRYSTVEDKFTVKEYHVTADSALVGSLTLEYFGPFYLSDIEIFFIKTINRILMIVCAVVIAAAFLLGSLIAKRISAPITSSIRTAEGIAMGDYSVPQIDLSSTVEVEKLQLTIRDLAHILESKETLRKRLTGDVAHELRTPLATLQSHLEAMIDGIWEPTQDKLKGIHEEIIRITGLVRDLETLSTYDSAGIVLSNAEENLFELSQTTASLFENKFAEGGVELLVEGEQAVCSCDRDMIKQVLINLLSNALKYTPRGGAVKIMVTADGEKCRVDVIDNGIGIPENDKPFVFERFYRVDHSRTRTSGGSGIGLSIVSEIIKSHGGQITLTSDPGRKTVFSFHLPIQNRRLET